MIGLKPVTRSTDIAAVRITCQLSRGRVAPPLVDRLVQGHAVRRDPLVTRISHRITVVMPLSLDGGGLQQIYGAVRRFGISY